MAFDDNLEVITVPVSADYSATGQYLAMKVNTSGQLATSGADAFAAGILQDNPAAAGRAGKLGIAGISKATAGGTITKGDALVVTTGGKLITATGGANPFAIALESAVSNDVFSVFLCGNDKRPTYSVVTVPVAALSSVADADVLMRFTPGYNGKIVSASFQVTTAVTTAAKATTLTPKIAGTSVTGGTVGLTSANCTPKGANVAGASITGANAFTSSQEITVVASATTAFVEGAGAITLVLG